MDGILNINKPYGKTSFNVVATVKRLTGERRVGHTGTLDPTATGVLPICLGQGTRVSQFLMEATKKYKAQIELGVTTDTYDASGSVVRQADSSGIDRDTVKTSLEAFRGDIRQTPPMYSAVKHGGRPLYSLARAGLDVARKSRPVTIYRLELTGWQPPCFTLEVTCGKGTYIRSLAHDLGQTLGCGAHLKSLTRTRYGCFDIAEAVSLTEMEEAFSRDDWQRFVYPVDYPLRDFSSVVIDNEGEAAMKNGQPLSLYDTNPADELCRAYSQDGRFLGILRHEPGAEAWRPEKVFY